MDGARSRPRTGDAAARHFSGGDAKKPLDVLWPEPTHVNPRVRVEPSDATITVQGVSIKSCPVSLKVEELAMVGENGDGLALPLKVQATRDGYVAMTTICAFNATAPTSPSRCAGRDLHKVRRRQRYAYRGLDVVVENERHTLKFGGMDEAVFTEWVLRKRRSIGGTVAAQALLTNEDDVRNELFASGIEASQQGC